ncbi:SMC-Scp complex subunit ScpB [Hirschia litorea]|uniref:SMC-Scp complex subunit ScpB n=1 Tax=Hirschia litorea TaxID=1199156 RepID=A0ABW2IGY0_9PROT
MEVAHAILGKDIYRLLDEAEAPQEPDSSTTPADTVLEALRRAEAILFATTKPIAASELVEMLPPGADVADILMKLQKTYAGRGIQLMEIAGGWRFQTAPDLAFLFEETREEQKKLSKAAMEMLSIIAYCQPCTRAEIEDVRGVAVSKGTLDVLMEMNWVKLRGRRKTPGRPVVYGTTDAFLEHFGIDSLDSLPGREEMKAAGLLSANIPDDFDMPRPSDSDADDDLLEIIDGIDDSMSDPAEFHIDFSEEDDV